MDLVAEYARLLGGYKGSWDDQAACRDVDTALFFPDRGSSGKAGLRVCKRCPVQYECLEYALETDQRHGIWGGKTAAEREKIRVLPKKS